jgi:hypothetical protein
MRPKKGIQYINLHSNLIKEVAFPPLFIKRVAEKGGLDISKYKMHELELGFKVELEHGTKSGKLDVTHDDPVKTLKIVMAHLNENPYYYHDLLKYVEKETPIEEKAESKSQQRFMGMVNAIQKGELNPNSLDNTDKFKKASKNISKKDVKDFASTKHKGLPEKIDETGLLNQGNHKLYITKSVDNFDDNKIKIVSDFIKFCCKHLGINQPITVHLTGKRGGPIQTTASFNPNNNEIWIYVKNRNMLADPMRSLAHEIRHLKQNLDGVITSTSGDDNSPHEQEAHCFSGLMIRLFGKMHPEIFI